jgi:hypothetical protein
MSSTQIKCDSPDIHDKEELIEQVRVSLAVTLNGKDRSKSSKPIWFDYYLFHTLTDIEPKNGPVTGHTPATVFGDLFNQTGVCNVTCRYDTTEVFNLGYTNTQVRCDSPPVQVPSDAIVQVALNGQQYTEYTYGENRGGSTVFDANPLRFKFYNVPLVTKFKPISGPSSGGSKVTIFGAGFL